MMFKRPTWAGAGRVSVVLTRRPVGRWGSRALVRRIDVQYWDPPCRPVVDERVLGDAALDQDRAWDSCLDRRLFLLYNVIGSGDR